MIKTALKWIREHYYNVIGSIAFYPAIIAVCFLILSWIMLQFDFSETGKHFKSQLSWLSLKDASTARSILSTVAGGIISLTVFSFSMVMIILNQAVSQMSNRLLNSMIGNRFQQIVLGFYIGTIVYALFLLTTIRDVQSGISVPAISIYLLIVFTVMDIFLFIYFLDYITQTVKYETIIKKVQNETLEGMEKKQAKKGRMDAGNPQGNYVEIGAGETGYFQDFTEKRLLHLADEQDLVLEFLHVRGTHLTKGTSLIRVYGAFAANEENCSKLHLATDFYHGQPVLANADYGFRQLTEVAMKALSPGINDPGTAVISMNALSALFTYHMQHDRPEKIAGKNGKLRIVAKVKRFAELFSECMLPIWYYGKEDYLVQGAFMEIIDQLKQADIEGKHTQQFDALRKQVYEQRQKLLV